MKKNLKIVYNIIFFIVIGLFLFQRVPMFLKNQKLEGLKIPSQSYVVLNPTEKEASIVFPNETQNTISIFWATWCAPCKLEMARLKKSVEENKIKSEQIIAINPYEDRLTILKFLNKEPYPFTFIEAPSVVETLKIELTPTTVFFKSSEVDAIKTGLSLIGIWQAERFLKD